MPGEEPLMLSVTPRIRAHLNVTGTGTTETQENLGIYEITETLRTLGMVGIGMVGM
jgi:hypothetical protein